MKITFCGSAEIMSIRGMSHECLASFGAEERSRPDRTVMTTTVTTATSDLQLLLLRRLTVCHNNLRSSNLQFSRRPERMYTRIPMNTYIKGRNTALEAMVKSSSGDRFVKFGTTPIGGFLDGPKRISGGIDAIIDRSIVKTQFFNGELPARDPESPSDPLT